MHFRAGAALTRSFSIFFRNLPTFFILGVLVYLPILAHKYWIVSSDDLWEIGERYQSHPYLWFLLETAIDFFVQATLVYAVFQQIRGEKAPIGKAIGVGLARLLPVLGVVLLLGLALIGAALPGVAMGYATRSPIVLALGALIPCVLVYVAFFVAVPASVVERPGVMMALKRSQQLTEGHRWGIFGLLLVTVVLAMVVGILMARALMTGADSIGDIRTLVIAQTLVELVFTIFGAVVAAVTYHDLRLEKDGVSVDELASVFE